MERPHCHRREYPEIKGSSFSSYSTRNILAGLLTIGAPWLKIILNGFLSLKKPSGEGFTLSFPRNQSRTLRVSQLPLNPTFGDQLPSPTSCDCYNTWITTCYNTWITTFYNTWTTLQFPPFHNPNCDCLKWMKQQEIEKLNSEDDDWFS